MLRERIPERTFSSREVYKPQLAVIQMMLPPHREARKTGWREMQRRMLRTLHLSVKEGRKGRRWNPDAES